MQYCVVLLLESERRKFAVWLLGRFREC